MNTTQLIRSLRQAANIKSDVSDIELLEGVINSLKDIKDYLQGDGYSSNPQDYLTAEFNGSLRALDTLWQQVYNESQQEEESEADKVIATHWVIGKYDHSQALHIVAFADEENAREWEHTAKRKYDSVVFTDRVSVLKHLCDNHYYDYSLYLTF
jgi:hypothetical protein